MPEIITCAGFEQHSKYHVFDVLTHIAKTVSLVPKERVLRLAMFFHDMGKPECFCLKNNEGHFYGHQKKSAEIAENTMRRLRYDNFAVSRVKLLVENHDRKLSADEVCIKRLLNKFGIEVLEQLCAVQAADAGAKSDYAKGEDKQELLKLVMEKARKIIERGECFSLSKLAVNGDDLINLGFKGAKIGEILQSLLEKVMSGEVLNDRQALLAIVEK